MEELFRLGFCAGGVGLFDTLFERGLGHGLWSSVSVRNTETSHWNNNLVLQGSTVVHIPAHASRGGWKYTRDN